MGIQEWLQSQLNWQEQPGLWLVGSVVMCVLASNLAGIALWYLRTRRPGALQALRQPAAPWVLNLLRWAYMVAPPYALLLMGIISPRSMGLSEIDWVHSMGMGGALAAGGLALLSLSWWSYRRSLPSRHRRPQLAHRSLLLRWLTALIETFALQAHWAFYRSVVADQAGLGGSQWEGWAGMGVVALEWVLNPLLRRSLQHPPHSEPVVRRAVLAIVTTALFILTRNFWLCWALHALFEALAQIQDGKPAKP
jgi:hypothetical protein